MRKKYLPIVIVLLIIFFGISFYLFLDNKKLKENYLIETDRVDELESQISELENDIEKLTNEIQELEHEKTQVSEKYNAILDETLNYSNESNINDVQNYVRPLEDGLARIQLIQGNYVILYTDENYILGQLSSDYDYDPQNVYLRGDFRKLGWQFFYNYGKTKIISVNIIDNDTTYENALRQLKYYITEGLQ